MGQSVALTRPFLDMGYAVVAPPASAFAGLTPSRPSRGRAVSSSPQLLLSERGGYDW